MRLLSPVAKSLAASALPLLLTACSSGATTASAPPAASTAPSAAAAAAPSSAKADAGPNAGLLTGTQLKSMLAPASSFASGLTLDAAGSRDTGDGYVAPVTTDVPTPDCTKLGGTSWTNITGITGVSFAQNDYIDKNVSSEVAQEIDVYQGTTAQTVINALGKIATVCPSYTDAQTSSKVKITEKATIGLGDSAYTLTLTSQAWKGGTTLVAARVGTAVVTVLYSDSGAGNGAAGAAKLTGQLVAALKGKA